MPVEVTVLALAAILQVVQYSCYSVTAIRQVGMGPAVGPRDKHVELTGAAGRFQRALNNHYEGLTLFTIAVLVVALADQSTALTRGLAWVYLGARVLYVPAYVLGLAPWRSLIWLAGLGATLGMILAALI